MTDRSGRRLPPRINRDARVSTTRPRDTLIPLENTRDLATTRRAKAHILYIEDLQSGRDSDGIKVEHPFRKQP